MFFAVASLFIFLMQVVIGFWFYFLFPSLGWKMPALFLPLALTAFVRFSMVYTRTHYGTLESLAYYTAYAWAGLVFILFSVVVVFAALQGFCTLLNIHAKALLGTLSLLFMTVSCAMAIYGGLRPTPIKHLDVFIPGAPEMTVAVISDSHLGVGVSLERFEKALARIKEQRPDAIFVLGDLFEYGMHRKKYAQALADFKTKYGTFGVFGNHEYYVGYENSAEFFRLAAIRRLDNEILTLPNGLQLIGINDVKTARVTSQQLDELLSRSDASSPRVLLSHQPLPAPTAATHNIPLTLSGHTHNGQIFPFNFLVKLTTPYVYGWYETGPHSKIYVTSGMFYWGMPLRFLAPSEIPILHIKNNA